MLHGKGYAPGYRKTSSMMILVGTMAESTSASAMLDNKKEPARIPRSAL
jgi:hypothetical protein